MLVRLSSLRLGKSKSGTTSYRIYPPARKNPFRLGFPSPSPPSISCPFRPFSCPYVIPNEGSASDWPAGLKKTPTQSISHLQPHTYRAHPAAPATIFPSYAFCSTRKGHRGYFWGVPDIQFLTWRKRNHVRAHRIVSSLLGKGYNYWVCFPNFRPGCRAREGDASFSSYRIMIPHLPTTRPPLIPIPGTMPWHTVGDYPRGDSSPGLSRANHQRASI